MIQGHDIAGTVIRAAIWRASHAVPPSLMLFIVVTLIVAALLHNRR